MTGLLAFDIQACLLAIAEEVGIVGNLLKSKSFAESSEVKVDGMRQGVGHVHLLAAGEANLFGWADHFLAEAGKGNGNFDSRAGLKAGGQTRFLIHYRKHATG